MLRFSGFLKNVSVILLAAVLLIVYAFLGKYAGILFAKDGSQLYTVTKNQFFYYCFSLGLIYNLVFHLFRIFYFGNSGKDSRGPGAKLKETMKTWWQFLIMSVNIFFGCYILFAGLANNAENYSFSSVTFIPVVGLIPLAITLLALPVTYFIMLKNLRGTAL